MKNWKRLSSKIIHKNSYGKVRVNKYDIGNGKVMGDYVVLDTPDVTIVFAVTTDKKVVMVNEYKAGGNYSGWELPAGYIDKEETPKRAASRELLEETGYIGEKPELLVDTFVAPGKMSMKVHCYLIRNAEKISEPDWDWAEDMDIKLFPLKQLKTMVLKGKIKGSASIATIYTTLDKLK